MDRALEASVCRALAGHPRDGRWGDGVGLSLGDRGVSGYLAICGDVCLTPFLDGRTLQGRHRPGALGGGAAAWIGLGESRLRFQ